MTRGWPLSMHVTSTDPKPSMSTVSLAFPVGSREPQTEPGVASKVMVMAAAVPGTPSILAFPLYSTYRP